MNPMPRGVRNGLFLAIGLIYGYVAVQLVPLVQVTWMLG